MARGRRAGYTDRSAMGAPLRRRFTLADRQAEARSDRGVMARALMYSFFAGAVAALVSVSVTGGAVAGVCLLAAAILLIGYDDLPRWVFPLLVAVGVAACVVGVYAGGSDYALLLALPAAFSAYFLGKIEAAVLVALAAGGLVAA